MFGMKLIRGLTRDATQEGRARGIASPLSGRRTNGREFTNPNYPSPFFIFFLFLHTGYAASWSSEKRHNVGDGGAVAPSHVGERVSSGIFYGAPRTVQGRIICSVCILPLVPPFPPPHHLSLFLCAPHMI